VFFLASVIGFWMARRRDWGIRVGVCGSLCGFSARAFDEGSDDEVSEAGTMVPTEEKGQGRYRLNLNT